MLSKKKKEIANYMVASLQFCDVLRDIYSDKAVFNEHGNMEENKESIKPAFEAPTRFIHVVVGLHPQKYC